MADTCTRPKVWDPERKKYVRDLGYKTVGLPSCDARYSKAYRGDMGWLGEPMNDREAAEYETKRARIIAENGGS